MINGRVSPFEQCLDPVRKQPFVSLVHLADLQEHLVQHIDHRVFFYPTLVLSLIVYLSAIHKSNQAQECISQLFLNFLFL